MGAVQVYPKADRSAGLHVGRLEESQISSQLSGHYW